MAKLYSGVKMSMVFKKNIEIYDQIVLFSPSNEGEKIYILGCNRVRFTASDATKTN